MPTAFPSVTSGPESLSLIPPANSVTPNSPTLSSEAHCSHPTEAHPTEVTDPAAPSLGVWGPNQTSPLESAVPNSRRYHRIAEVRQQQGLSLRTISRRTGLEVKELRRQENPATNLTLAQIRQWQRALEVPLVDLLEDESDTLSRPVKERAQMVRIMKTVVSLGETCQGNLRMTRLTTMLREQVLQLMPELSEIGGWPQCGSRRGPDVMGRIFHEPVTLGSSCE